MFKERRYLFRFACIIILLRVCIAMFNMEALRCFKEVFANKMCSPSFSEESSLTRDPSSNRHHQIPLYKSIVYSMNRRSRPPSSQSIPPIQGHGRTHTQLAPYLGVVYFQRLYYCSVNMCFVLFLCRWALGSNTPCRMVCYLYMMEFCIVKMLEFCSEIWEVDCAAMSVWACRSLV